MSIVQQINVVALQRAAEAAVGPENAEVISNLYILIDIAMKEGYDLGVIDGEAKADSKLDAAFDNGFAAGAEDAHERSYDDSYDEGFKDGFREGRALASLADETAAGIIAESDGYDEGYVDGVADARIHPSEADKNVANIIAAANQYAINGEFDAEELYRS